MRFTVNQGRTLENKKKELFHKHEGPSNKAVEPLKPVQAVVEAPGKTLERACSHANYALRVLDRPIRASPHYPEAVRPHVR
jgi:hypothetical protein